jgi:hypothetical protein
VGTYFSFKKCCVSHAATDSRVKKARLLLTRALSIPIPRGFMELSMLKQLEGSD